MKTMKDGTSYNQADIVLIPFPYTDLSGTKQRPALIISNEQLNNTNDRICCLITSNLAFDGLEIKRDHFKEGKLPFRSWVKPQRIFTINKRIIRKKLCRINEKFYKQIADSVIDYIRFQ